MGFFEGVLQADDTRYVGSIARHIVQTADASTARGRVIALRDYLRAHVSYLGAPFNDRPFLRATAIDVLRSGHGYCGEVTRAFICLAAAVGIPAQRINLYGRSPHVVAEAELAPGDRVIVDCQNPPHVPGLERLDQLVLSRKYEGYSTLNLRRLYLQGLFSRVTLQIGPLTFWTENPHALKATLWFLLTLALLGFQAGKMLIHIYLHRRGWVRTSNRAAIRGTVIVTATDPGHLP
jgi:hypothetical protein